MNVLKKLIALKETNSVDDTKYLKHEVDDLTKAQTFYESGYKTSISVSGSPKVLKTCLIDVFQDYKEKSRLLFEEQSKLKQPYIEEQQRLKSELSKRQTIKEIKERDILNLDNEIIKIDKDINEIPRNPQKYGIDADKKPKAQFYIGLFILFPITLYLLVFYISASFSAFFKEFDPNTNVLAAIFDGQALSKAYNDPNGGLLEIIFLVTIPFAFMGLGYLVHMFQKEEKTGKYKVAALFIITFIFDSILAYLIEHKIFEFNKLPGEVFSLKLAFQSVEFWGIIFAGFVVYAIWGLVFDFVMKEYENIDKIKNFIASLSSNKKQLLNQRATTNNLIQDVEKEISEIKGKVEELQSKIDGFIFERKRYLIYHAQYLKGWLVAIGEEIALPRNQKDLLIEECLTVEDMHLKAYNVDKEDSENIIYK
jgi:hypothetical protein